MGYNKWRDPLKPTQILNRLCKEEKLDGPYYADGEVTIGKCIITGPSELIDSRGKKWILIKALTARYYIFVDSCHLETITWT